MNAEGDLTEGSLTNQLHELIILQGGRRQLVVLFNVRLHELYEPVSFLENSLVDLSGSL